jgi:hypothetical protein
MADRVDPSVQGVEASDDDSMLDRPAAEADLVQLPARHNPMLVCRQRRQAELG